MSISASIASPSRVLVFPFPALGHMIPLLDLTHHLVSQNVGVTILVTPKNLHLLNPLLSSNPAIELLVLPFPAHTSMPPGIENVKDLPSTYFYFMISALSQLYTPLLHWFQSHPSPPSLIISDMFLGWTHRLAAELGIRRVLFSPSGAMGLSVVFNLWRNMRRRNNPNDPDEVFSFPNIPGSPRFPWWKLSPIYQKYVDRGDQDPDWESIREGFQANPASWGIVFNSFNELEGVYLEHLRKEVGHHRVWAVGPLLPPDNQPGRLAARGGSSSVSTEEISSWLDTRQDHKVVYISFGSQAVLTNAQMEALASGLEESGVHFVWSVKEPTGAHEAGKYGKLPRGFVDRVAEAGRGLVIRGWVPQVTVLSHRAVGGFLTHCGWNSVLEGILGGVVMLMWPMSADQYTNATLLVDHLKVGMRGFEGRETVPEPGEVSRMVVELVEEKGEERRRVGRLRKDAVEAIKEDGSSLKDLKSFVENIQ